MNLDQALISAEQKMVDAVASDVQVLQDASRHIISAGGKRVRPRMMFLSYLLCGGANLTEAVPVAAAVELVHTATLVHDDINDHGVIRRGRVTINEKWGRTFALLTGDFLFTQVYALMAPYGDLNVIFSEATVALVEGETLQAHAAKTNSLNRETYQQIVAKKTASLFRASTRLGAALAHADKETVEILGEYGFYVGLAFQIVDDLLDLIGDPEVMGKTAGVDIGQGKGVAAAYHTNGHDAAHGAGMAMVAERAVDPIVAIKQRAVEKGAIEEGRQMAATLAEQANAALDKLPQNAHVEGLREIISQVVDREA